jgi:hypothetical protein
MTKKRLSIIFICLISLGFKSCVEEEARLAEQQGDQLSISQEGFSLPSTPDTVFFCNEQLLIDNFDRKERLDKELIVNTFYHSSTIQIIKKSNRYLPVIEEILAANDIPDDFKYLCIIESALSQVTSPSGAKGFWQFMPQTAREFRLRVDSEVDERLHVEKSTQAACQYLKTAHSKFNDWVLVAASYNMGMAGIQTALDDQGVSSFFDLHLNSETSRYIFRILALKLILERPTQYGFVINDKDLYQVPNTKTIIVDSSISNLKKWSKGLGSNYHMVKVLNPWIIGNKLTYRNESFKILLPNN